MPKTCLDLRTKLEIEQRRLLDFGEAGGLLDYKDGQDLPEPLRAEKLLLVAVLTQIGCKFEEFAVLNSKYIQLQPQTEAQRDQAYAVDISATFSTLKLKWENGIEGSPRRKEYWKGTNHIVRYCKTAKDIVKEPKRLLWVGIDEENFKQLLQELRENNNYLHELLSGQAAKRLEDTTMKTLREMVLLRGQISDLQRLVVDTVIWSDHQQMDVTPRAARLNNRSHDLLKSLVDTKILNVSYDFANNQKPPDYREATQESNTRLLFTSIKNVEAPTKLDLARKRERTLGKYEPANGEPIDVWIEWKPYATEPEPGDDGPSGMRKEIPVASNVTRIKELVALLQKSGSEDTEESIFRVPKCLGYYNFRGDESGQHPRNKAMFGIVFESFTGSKKSTEPPPTLTSLLATESPSLSTRRTLAYKIAYSILYLHTVKWFHKGIRSDCIIFRVDATTGQPDINNPYVTGFEYSRPDRNDAHTTRLPPWGPNEVYVHPKYQGGNATTHFKRSYDIYSLGIVLLEIAYWQPISAIIATDFPGAKALTIEGELTSLNLMGEKVQRKELSPQDAAGVRDLLLRDDKPYLPRLKRLVGDRFHRAIHSCIKGMTADGDDETDIRTSAALQRDFTELVVENLAAMEV
jgi:hypothetical protein